MNAYHSNISAQIKEVSRMLRLPNLLPYEERSLLGRQKGLGVQVLASPSMRADMARKALQRKQQQTWS
jgi:hypothetical protein